jgi:hypothetical protein
MSRSTDKYVEKYVSDKMPARVKKALAEAQFSLYYGSGGGGMGWVKASKIVEEWWDKHMRDDLAVDDGGNVSTEHEFKRWLEQIADERYKEATQEAIDQDYEEDEVHPYASREAENYADGAMETTTVYDSGDVKRLILGKDWP